MNEQDFNEFEQRLAQMRPADPRPTVKYRIAEAIEASELNEAAEGPETDASLGGPRLFRRSVVVGLAVAAMIAFASLVTLVVLQGPDAGDIAEQDPPSKEVVDVAAPTEPTPPAAPTLLALTRAWNESPDALDALLSPAAPAIQRRNELDPEPVPTLADSRRGTYLLELP